MPHHACVFVFPQGEPRVENVSEPKVCNVASCETREAFPFLNEASFCVKMVIYDKPYFSGKSRTISSSMRDFMTRAHSQQTTFMYSVGSLKVLGGM